MKKQMILFALIPLLVSCGQTADKTEKAPTKKITKVKVHRVKSTTIQNTLNYSGTISPSETIPLTFQSIDKVTRIYVDEGDFVKKGQLLAEVDNRSMQSALQAAQAQYEQAVDARKRLKKVYDSGSLPEVKWVEINSKVVQAEANRDIYSKNLENCELRAPSDGFIGKRHAEVGMAATQVQAPFELIQIEQVLAKISVPENEIGLIEKGLESLVVVAALKNREYEGIVDKVGVVANRLSRTYDVKIKIENTDLKLKPGMVCEVEVRLPASEAAILVPVSAVERDEQDNVFVYLVDEKSKQAIKKTVQVDGIVNNQIAVEGLAINDLIVVKGTQKLSNKMEVSW